MNAMVKGDIATLAQNGETTSVGPTKIDVALQHGRIGVTRIGVGH